jgi:hypothetical protein
MSRSNLHRLISPKSIAVVGNRGADFAIKESKKLGFNHKIWAVHPTLDKLEGIQCYRDIKDLPEAYKTAPPPPIDLRSETISIADSALTAINVASGASGKSLMSL